MRCRAGEHPAGVNYVHAYHVVDCPDHPASALVCPSGRRFCFACGSEVLPDVLGSGADYTAKADDALNAEARDAWNGSRVIRDFAAACQPGTRALTTKVAQ